MQSRLSSLSIVVVLALLFTTTFLSQGAAHAQWANPTATPPANNAPTPVNVAASSQAKSGGLGVGSMVVGGGLKMGYTGTTCNASTAGTIIYDAGTLTVCSNIDELGLGNSSEYWTRVGNNIYYELGGASVGTDTVAPNSLLTVAGGIAATQYCDSVGNNCIIHSDLNKVSWQETLGNLWYTLGNIGIGTNNPSRKLSVHVNTAGNSAPLLIKNDNPGTNAIGLELANATARSVIESRRNNVAQSGADLIFKTTNAVGNLVEYMRIKEGGAVGIGDSTPDGGLRLDVAGKLGANEYCDQNGANCVLAANLNDSLWLSTAGGNIYRASGSVGVGTASPQEGLHVNANIRTDARKIVFADPAHSLFGGTGGLYYDSATTTRSSLHLRTRSNEFLGSLFGYTGGYFGLLDSDGDWTLISHTDDFMQFRINRVPLMTLTAGGGIAVATSTVSAGLAFDINGRVGATEYCDADGNNCRTMDEIGGLWDASGADIYRASGRVSIGTAAPSAGLMLDVEGQIGGIQFCDENGANCFTAADVANAGGSAGPPPVGGSGTVNRVAKWTAGGAIGDSSISDNGTMVTAAGNLQTNNRHLYLGSQDLYGDNAIALYYDSNHSTATTLVMRDAQNTRYGQLYGDGDGANFGLLDRDGQWAVRHQSNVFTRWYINNVAQMTLNTNGLGIGRTNPANKLHVQGNIGATGWIGAGCEVGCNSSGGYALMYGDGRFVGTGSLRMNYNNPTIYLQDTDHYSGMLHQNSNLFYILSGSGVNSLSWATNANGRYPMYINMINNNAVFGGNINAISFTQASDARLKKDIVTTSGLDTIMQLRGVDFTWRESGKQSIGLIAQEVERVLPQLVTETDITDPETGEVIQTEKSVEYANLVAPLIEAVKEQQQTIELLESRIELLESQK